MSRPTAQKRFAWRASGKALGAAWAALLLAAMAHATIAPCAEASETGLVSITVPTELPCVLLADGSVVAPTGYEIGNSSSVAVRLAQTVTSNAPEGVSYEIHDANGLVSSYDGSDHVGALEIEPGSAVSLEWRIGALDAARHADTIAASTRKPTRLFNVAFSFEAVQIPLTGSVITDGDARVGSEIIATATGLPADADARIEWVADGSVVATGSSWMPGPEHEGKTVVVRVFDASGLYGGFIASSELTIEEGVLTGTVRVSVSGASLIAHVENAPRWVPDRLAPRWQAGRSGRHACP